MAGIVGILVLLLVLAVLFNIASSREKVIRELGSSRPSRAGTLQRCVR